MKRNILFLIGIASLIVLSLCDIVLADKIITVSGKIKIIFAEQIEIILDSDCYDKYKGDNTIWLEKTISIAHTPMTFTLKEGMHVTVRVNKHSRDPMATFVSWEDPVLLAAEAKAKENPTLLKGKFKYISRNYGLEITGDRKRGYRKRKYRVWGVPHSDKKFLNKLLKKGENVDVYYGVRVSKGVHAAQYDTKKMKIFIAWGPETKQKIEERKKSLAKQRTEEEREKKRKKAEEEQKKLLAQKRLKNFEKKYRVTEWPVMKEFHVNPFIYEGKKVAFVSDFGTMLSATEGLFECSGELFIVSDIPKGFFTKEAEVVIAGRPLGKKETKLPLFGEVLVPNLKFVGAYICEKQHCRDIVWE